MKNVIILIIVVLLVYFIVIKEHFDPSANLNLLTNSEIRFSNPIRIPISADSINDQEVLDPVQFNQRSDITILQMLKAINNILERIKDVSITESSSKKLDNNVFSNIITFNPALLPIKTYEPDANKLRMLNNLIINQLNFYSGGQYELNILDADNTFAAETDDQYRIAYNLYGTINDIKLKIIVDIIIMKSSITDTDLRLIFSELRIDNPNVYITPFSDLNNDNYVSINDYSKSLK